MHYYTRSPNRTAYLERLSKSPYAGKVHFHHDDGPAEQKLDLVSVLRTPVKGTHLYVCGPNGFLDAVRATARKCGWSEAQIHFEYFAGGAVHSADDRSFEVQIGRNGRIIRVEAAQTIMQALADNVIQISTSCE